MYIYKSTRFRFISLPQLAYLMTRIIVSAAAAAATHHHHDCVLPVVAQCEHIIAAVTEGAALDILNLISTLAVIQEVKATLYVILCKQTSKHRVHYHHSYVPSRLRLKSSYRVKR